MEAIVVIALYFLPTIIAASRRHANVGSIAVVNFFFGWTVIGWIIALAMAAGNGRANGQTIVIRNENVIGDGNRIRRGWESDLEEEAPQRPGKIRNAIEDRVASQLKPTASHSNGVRNALSQSSHCPSGHPVLSTAQYCLECGVALGTRCENGHVMTSGKFCSECGGRVGSDAPASGR